VVLKLSGRLGSEPSTNFRENCNPKRKLSLKFKIIYIVIRYSGNNKFPSRVMLELGFFQNAMANFKWFTFNQFSKIDFAELFIKNSSYRGIHIPG